MSYTVFFGVPTGKTTELEMSQQMKQLFITKTGKLVEFPAQHAGLMTTF